MTTRVDIEEIEATKSEKFLALVLLAFLLIGTIWFYVKLDAWVPGGPNYAYTAAEQRIIDANEAALAAESRTEARYERAKTELALTKDELDIALAKGVDTAPLEAAYERERTQFDAAQKAWDRARAASEKSITRVNAMDDARANGGTDTHRWVVAGVRLGFIVAWLLASLRVVGNLRRRQSRFLPLGFAAAGAGVITAVVYATDYITDYISWRDVGPIVLSAAGVIATVGAFIGLQRWLAARIPGRRVRNGECPFCGHPQRGESPHCEGCGREVIAPCASCSQPRRVGSPHCGACGNP